MRSGTRTRPACATGSTRSRTPSRRLRRLDRLRTAELCLLVPAVEPGFRRAVFVAGGRVAAVRTLPPGGGAAVELEAGLAACRGLEPSYAPEHADELLLVASFLRRPPPELKVLTLGEARAAA